MRQVALSAVPTLVRKLESLLAFLVRLACVAGVVAMVCCSSVCAQSPEFAGTPLNPARSSDETQVAMIPDGNGGAYVSFKTGPGVNLFNCPVVVVHLLADGQSDPAWDPSPLTGLYSDTEHIAPMLPVEDGSLWVFGGRTGGSSGAPWFAQRRAGPAAVLQQVRSLPTPPGFAPSYTFAIRGPNGRLWFVRPRVDAVRFGPDTIMTSFPTSVPVNFLGGGVVSPNNGVGEDGVGGAYIVLGLPNVNADNFVQLTDLIVYRLAADGTVPWSPPSRVVTTAVRDQFAPQVLADSTNGVLIVWVDRRSLSTFDDIYALRLLPDGSLAPGWALNGSPLAAVTGLQFAPAVASDGAGGAWVVWTDSRSGANDLFFTHVTPSGTPAPGFPAGGRALVAAPGTQTEARLVPDGAGGFLCAWQDHRNGGPDLYGLHIAPDGSVAPGWEPNGSALCTNPASQSAPVLVSTSPGHAIMAWLDGREGLMHAFAMAFPATGAPLATPRTGGGALALSACANPARGEIELELSSPEAEDLRLTLFDAGGRVLSDRAFHGPLQRARVRFDRVSPGLYFARATQGGAQIMRRIAVVQ